MYRYISELGFRTPAIINSLKIFIKDFKDVSTISVSQLSSEQIKSALEIHQLPWQLNTDSTKMTREYKFNSFKDTFAFMGSISIIADEMNHYPRWTQKENTVVVEVTTPDCRGLSVKDVLLAHTMENVAVEVCNSAITSVCDSPRVSTAQLLSSWNSNYSKTEELIQGFQRTTAQL